MHIQIYFYNIKTFVANSLVTYNLQQHENHLVLIHVKKSLTVVTCLKK